MVVKNELYARILCLILKDVEFEVVRVDKEDAVLIILSKEAVRAGYPNTTIIEKPRIEHLVTSKYRRAPHETTRSLLEFIGSLDQQDCDEKLTFDEATMMINGLGSLVSFPDRALIYPERLVDRLKAAAHRMAIAEEMRALVLAAKQGDVHAQYNLAEMLYEGEGGPKNHNEARRLYELAAKQGHADAQYNLAEMLYEGEGGPKNHNEAWRLYELAAKQGHADAQCNLAYMLCEGEGGPKNLEEARRLRFELAAKQGHADAQCNLAYMLYCGQGGPKNFEEARRLWDLAAKQGDAVAQCNFAEMLYKGEGGPKNLAEARRLLAPAAKQGDADAVEMLRLVMQEMEVAAVAAGNALLAEEEEAGKKARAKAAKASKKHKAEVSGSQLLLAACYT